VIQLFRQVSDATITVASDVFFRQNPALGYKLPRMTGDEAKDHHRAAATAAVILWWNEISQKKEFLTEGEEKLTEILNWARTATIDQSTNFFLPPRWDDRPTWGTLRTHARDGGGLTVRLLEEVAWALLLAAYYGRLTSSHFTGCEKLGLAWHWAQLAHAARQYLEGNKERFLSCFPPAPASIPTEDREKFLEWVKSLDPNELESLVDVLNRRQGWCRDGILQAMERLEEVTDDQIRKAAKTLWDEGFEPLQQALKEGRLDLSEIL